MLAYVFRSFVARLRSNLITMLAVLLFVAGSTMGVAVYASLHDQLISTTPPENILVLAKGAASERASRLEIETARKASLLDGVKKLGDVPLAARELVTTVSVQTSNLRKYEEPVAIRGIDELSLQVHRAKVIKGAAPSPGSLDVILGRRVADRYPNLTLGSSLDLPGGAAKVSGVFSADGGPFEDEVWTPRSALEIHLKVNFSGSLTLVADSASRVPDLVATINASKDLDAVATSVVAFRERSAGLETILRTVLVLLILLAVVATFAIATTMNAAIAVRMPELAAMVAIGIRRSRLARLVIVESTLLATSGAVLGVVASELVRSQVTTLRLGVNPIELAPMAIIPVIGLLLGTLVGVVGGIAPALAVSRLDIVRTLR